jgi:hypothetical protein
MTLLYYQPEQVLTRVRLSNTAIDIGYLILIVSDYSIVAHLIGSAGGPYELAYYKIVSRFMEAVSRSPKSGRGRADYRVCGVVSGITKGRWLSVSEVNLAEFRQNGLGPPFTESHIVQKAEKIRHPRI